MADFLQLSCLLSPKRCSSFLHARGRTRAIVWLRSGVHYQPQSPLTLEYEDSGTIYAGYPKENVCSSVTNCPMIRLWLTAVNRLPQATLSASAGPLPTSLAWKRLPSPARLTMGLRTNGLDVWRAELPKSVLETKFVGLFADGVRLPRARYPNCADITGVDCYTLNASSATSSPNTPLQHLSNGIIGDVGYNLDVRNQVCIYIVCIVSVSVTRLAADGIDWSFARAGSMVWTCLQTSLTMHTPPARTLLQMQPCQPTRISHLQSSTLILPGGAMRCATL